MIIITSLFYEGIVYTMYIQWRYLHMYTMQPTEQCISTVGPSFNQKKKKKKERKKESTSK